jgi:hypothetical protein
LGLREKAFPLSDIGSPQHIQIRGCIVTSIREI